MLIGLSLLAWYRLKEEPISLDVAFGSITATPTLRFDRAGGNPDVESVVLGDFPTGALDALQRAAIVGDQWAERFAVYAVAEQSDPPVPILGSYEIEPTAIRFRPRFPLTAGLVYRVRGRFGAVSLDTTIALPSADRAPTTVVTAVYPSGPVLPMNQFRMYVHFSVPMRIGEAYDHITLYDSRTGREVADPFVIIEAELWDPGRQRFTLLFDPGRIKRGLRPNEEAGLPLQTGSSYRLVIDAGWRDGRDAPMAAQFEKLFRAVDADRESPDPDTWQVTVPRVGTKQPVVLQFPEPLDRALLRGMLTVRTDRGQEVAGAVQVGEEERSWSFVPSALWKPGRYVIQVDTGLEDLAGNNLRRLFDENLGDLSPQRFGGSASMEIPFEVR